MLSGSKPRLLVQIGITIGVVAAIFTSIMLIGFEIRDQASEIATTRANQEEERQKLNNLAQLKSERTEALPYLTKLRTALPERDSLLSLPGELSDIAGENNVGMSFAFGGEVEGNIEFSMTIQGNYSNITEFIKAVESEFIFMNLEGIDVIGGGDNYTASLRGRIHFND